jgi:hypothetical protein
MLSCLAACEEGNRLVMKLDIVCSAQLGPSPLVWVGVERTIASSASESGRWKKLYKGLKSGCPTAECSSKMEGCCGYRGFLNPSICPKRGVYFGSRGWLGDHRRGFEI